MHKIALRIVPAVLAFSIGISLTFLITGQAVQWLASPVNRSCQVKEVRANGRVVWTPCDHWKSQS
jgi:hypothetical protein